MAKLDIPDFDGPRYDRMRTFHTRYDVAAKDIAKMALAAGYVTKIERDQFQGHTTFVVRWWAV